MDPVTRSIVYASINRLLLAKRSVILTSHTITEIDRVCDRIGIMRQGKMLITAPPQQLKTMYGNRYAITVYYDQIEALTIERVSIYMWNQNEKIKPVLNEQILMTQTFSIFVCRISKKQFQM